MGAAQGARTGRGDGLALKRTAAAVALVLATSACGGDSGTPVDELRASGAPLYWLGDEFDGLPLTHSSDRGFVYGDCEPKSDTGCAPPLQLQHWPLAKRHPSKFTITPGTPMPCTRESIEGTLVAAFPTTGGLEVYVGRTVVVIFAEWERSLRAVRALRPLGGGDRLPRPPAALGRALARCELGLRQTIEAGG